MPYDPQAPFGPLLTGGEAETERLKGGEALDADESAIRPGEKYFEYRERMLALVEEKRVKASDATERTTRLDLRLEADRKWLHGRAMKMLGAKGITRPNVEEYRSALTTAASLLVTARAARS